MGIMELIYDAREVYEFLSSDPSRNHSAVKSYSRKAGLMQVFYEIIPMGTGKTHPFADFYVHLGSQRPQFSKTTKKRFQEQNQSFQDASDAIKHNRAKMSSPEDKNRRLLLINLY
jgi:predicted ATPase